MKKLEKWLVINFDNINSSTDTGALELNGRKWKM